MKENESEKIAKSVYEAINRKVSQSVTSITLCSYLTYDEFIFGLSEAVIRSLPIDADLAATVNHLNIKMKWSDK